MSAEEHCVAGFSSLLDEQIGADVKKLRQLPGLRLADGTLAPYHLGSNPPGAKDLPQVLLGETPGLHQMEEHLVRLSLADGMTALLEVFDEHGQELGQFPLLRGRRITLVQAH